MKKVKDEQKITQEEANIEQIVEEPPQPQGQMPEQADDVEMLRESAKVAANQMMEALKQCEALNAALQEAKKEAQAYKDQMLRQKAEFDNYRKRTAGELVSTRDDGAMETLRLLLPTLDNLERALEAAREEGSTSVVKGLDMVVKNLIESFERKGFKEIEALGQPFDPKLHEAVMQEPTEDENKKQTVAQVLQKGYLYKEKVLRYVTVKVYI